MAHADPYAVETDGDLTIRKPGPLFVVVGPGSERIGPPCSSLAEAKRQVAKYLGNAPAESAGSEPVSGSAAASSAPPELPVGFSITKRGGWYKVLDAAGKKVGSKRTHEEAVALANAGD